MVVFFVVVVVVAVGLVDVVVIGFCVVVVVVVVVVVDVVVVVVVVKFEVVDVVVVVVGSSTPLIFEVVSLQTTQLPFTTSPFVCHLYLCPDDEIVSVSSSYAHASQYNVRVPSVVQVAFVVTFHSP